MPRFRRPPFDVALALAVAGVMAVEVAAYAASPARAVPAALLVGTGLLLRRRVPLAGFLLAAAGLSSVSMAAPGFDGESLSFVVTFLIAHYSLGRWALERGAWAGALLVLASMVVFAVGDARANGASFSDVDAGAVGFTVVFVGGPWAAGLAIRLLQDRRTALDEENRRLVADQEEHARRAVAEERARIARELHDVVSHAIAVTVLQARGARRTLGVDEGQVRRALDAIEHTNTAALSDMRRLLAVLRDTEHEAGIDPGPDLLAPQPSLTHLDGLIDRVRESGLPVELSINGTACEVPPGVDLSAYRIVQEALTNVLKHAGAARATVRLDYGEHELTVKVSDDGSGGDGTPGTGHGLIGIGERAAVVGGELTAGRRAGGGFEVRARLPYALEPA